MLNPCEIEDGEILSDSDDNNAQESKSESKVCEPYNVVQRPDTSKYTKGGVAYRSTTCVYSSSEEHDSDSAEEGSPVKKKQQKTEQRDVSMRHGGYRQDRDWVTKAHSQIVNSVTKGKKPNSIWSSVLEEETISSCVSQLNRNDKFTVNRGAESYNYSRRDLVKPEQFSDADESDSSDMTTEDCPADLATKETFGFTVDKKPTVKSRLGKRNSRESSYSSTSHSRSTSLEDIAIDGEVKVLNGSDVGDSDDCDRQPTKNRHKYKKGKTNGDHSKASSQISVGEKTRERNRSMDSSDKRRGTKRKHYEGKASKKHCLKRNVMDVEVKPMKLGVSVNPQMQDQELADVLVDALREPTEKIDLILKMIDMLGAEKVIKIFKATEDVEEMGGLMIQNGRRRRTPGGVFFFLVRSDCDITAEQLQTLFEDQRNEYRAFLKAKKKELRKARQLQAQEKNKVLEMETEAIELQEDNDAVNIELS